MSEKIEFTRVRNFIDGEWVEETGVKYVPLFNPSTGEQIGEVPLSSKETSTAAVESSQKAYESWRQLSVSKRMSYLFALREAMRAHLEELAVAIAVDQAKHISEARGEVQRVIEIIETACSIPTLMQGDTLEGVATNINAKVIRQPLGVFGGVAPFNFPALVFGWFVPFAIGVGNAFVFKPSPLSPMFMQKMGDIFNEIGLPKGVVNIVNGEADVPEAWYDNRKISGVCMVGSTRTAKIIARRCGETAKRSMLLAGAKNYLVVMEDAEMDLFVENYLHSCYGSAGQRCLAGSIVAAVPEIYDQMLEAIVEVSHKVKIGDAMDPDVYMGPVISKEAKERVENYVDIGIQDGAKLILDGRNPKVADRNKDGFFIGPTIFTDVTPDMRIAREEIFGPFVSVMRINDLDEVLGLIREQEYGNGACIFTQNLYYTQRFIGEADVGMVGVNVGICAPHPYLPFGGIKHSLVGTDKVQGKAGVDFFTQEKVATVRFTSPTGVYSKKEKPGKTEACESGDIRSCIPS
ncbi:MAG: CoA-acylating methylmalonate-semialdehyde dehydrogenase [Desulfoferrobacter sp.]